MEAQTGLMCKKNNLIGSCGSSYMPNSSIYMDYFYFLLWTFWCIKDLVVWTI